MSSAPFEDFKYAKFLDLINPSVTQVRRHGVALFGLGRAGTIHLKNLIENTRVDLMYVIEERVDRRNEVRNLMNFKTTQFMGTEETESVLDDKRVEFVVIATPTQFHHPLVVSALKKGKGVFCEKPVATEFSDIQMCYEMASKLGLPLLSAFNRRFDPSFQSVETRVRNGEVGSVHVIKTCSRDSPPPSIDYLKSSSGIFHDSAIHDIDLICWILKEFPSQVFAVGKAHRPEIAEIKHYDTVAIHLNFPSGAMGLIDMSRYANYGYDQRLEVFGPNGMLACGNQTSLGIQAYTPKGIAEPPIWYSFASRYEEAYKKEIEHFLNVLEGKEELIVKPHETLKACQIASACDESAITGMPIKMAKT